MKVTSLSRIAAPSGLIVLLSKSKRTSSRRIVLSTFGAGGGGGGGGGGGFGLARGGGGGGGGVRVGRREVLWWFGQKIAQTPPLLGPLWWPRGAPLLKNYSSHLLRLQCLRRYRRR